MFDLVADVEKYPEFVPLCQSLTVRKRIPEADQREAIVCDMRVGYKAIRESLVSRVTLDRPNLKILVEYVEGPFSHLENKWRFAPDGEATCNVEFFIDYAFSSRVLAMLMGAMFDTAFRKFSDAFVARADRVYGRPTVASIAEPGRGRVL